MPLRASIDDANTTLISYAGNWEQLTGSSRQWESTVHGSLQPGSTATFSFRGYQVWVWGTIPAGSGSSFVDISIDGSSPNSTSRASNGSAVYNEVFYESPLLNDGQHTIVVTNQGSSANANQEFLLDRFEFETSDNVPAFVTPSSSSAAPSTTSSTTTPSTTGMNGSVGSSGGSKLSSGAIAGIVIGVLLFAIMLILIFLWRRRSLRTKRLGEKPSNPQRSTLVPTPFVIHNEGSSTNAQSTAGPLASPDPSETDTQSRQYESRPEKGGYAVASSPVSPPATVFSSSGTTDSVASPTFSVATAPLVAVGDVFDHPPPSYSQQNASH